MADDCSRFWAPVPWMLEAAVVLTLVLGRQADVMIISFLLVFKVAVFRRFSLG